MVHFPASYDRFTGACTNKPEQSVDGCFGKPIFVVRLYRGWKGRAVASKRHAAAMQVRGVLSVCVIKVVPTRWALTSYKWSYNCYNPY